MKQIKLLIIPIIVLLGACSKLDYEQIQAFSNFENVVEASKFSKNIYNLGISKINLLSSKEEKITMGFHASTVNLNGFELNLSDIILEHENTEGGKYYTIKSKNTGETYDLFLNKKTHSFFINDELINFDKMSTKELVFYIVIGSLNNEIYNEGEARISFIEYSKERNLKPNGINKMCEMGATSIRAGRSVAIHNSQALAADFIKEHPGSQIIGTDTGCLWEDFGCISITTINYPC